MRLEVDGKTSDLSLDQIYEAIGGWQKFTEAGREILPRAWDLLHNRKGRWTPTASTSSRR